MVKLKTNIEEPQFTFNRLQFRKSKKKKIASVTYKNLLVWRKREVLLLLFHGFEYFTVFDVIVLLYVILFYYVWFYVDAAQNTLSNTIIEIVLNYIILNYIKFYEVPCIIFNCIVLFYVVILYFLFFWRKNSIMKTWKNNLKYVFFACYTNSNFQFLWMHVRTHKRVARTYVRVWF